MPVEQIEANTPLDLTKLSTNDLKRMIEEAKKGKKEEIKEPVISNQEKEDAPSTAPEKPTLPAPKTTPRKAKARKTRQSSKGSRETELRRGK